MRIIRKVSLFLTLTVISVSSFSLELTRQKAVDIFIENSPLSANIFNDIKIKNTEIYPFMEPYAWELSSSIGYEKSEAESFTSQNIALRDQSSFSFGLSKYFYTGTTASVHYSKEAIRNDLGGFYSSSLAPILNQDQVYLEVRQNIFNNFLGRQERLNLNAFRERLTASTLEKFEELELGILQVLTIREDLIATKAELDSAKRIYEQFEGLAAVVRKKEQIGASLPGDTARAKASLEDLKQVILEKQNTVYSLESQIRVLLGLDAEASIETTADIEKLKKPSFPEVTVSELRPVVIQNHLLEGSRLTKKVADDETRPDLDLVGRYGFTGVEEDNGESFSEMLSGKKPTAYIGVELSYKFGADVASNKRRKNRLEKVKAETLKEHFLREITSQEKVLREKILNAVELDESLTKAVSLRQDSLKKTKRNYERAQVELDTFVNEVDNLFKVENKLIKNKGQYRILVHEYAALVDKLIDLNNLENLK